MMASETELEAGRALDALIAEKVMGWTVELIVGRHDAVEEWRDSQGWRYGPDPKPFSTDIAFAWEVALNLGIAIIPVDGGFLAGCFNDTFAPTYISDEDGVIDGRMDQYAKAETAPLAICRAALAAVKAQPDASH